MKVVLPGVPLDSSAPGKNNASSQTESTWSQAETNWPPTNLPLTISDEVEELTSAVIKKVRDLGELGKEIEMLLLLNSTQTQTLAQVGHI